MAVVAVGVPLGVAMATVTSMFATRDPTTATVEVPAPAPGTPLTSDVTPASVLCDPPGCETWRFAARGRLDVALSADRDTVVVTSRPAGTIHALDAATGTERWRHATPTNRHTQLLGDTILLWTKDELVALALGNGEVRWSIPSPVTPHRPVYRLVREAASPVAGEHRVSDGWVTPGPDPVAILVGYRGLADREILFALDLRTGDELWSVDDATATGLVDAGVVVIREHAADSSDPDALRSVGVLDAHKGVERWSTPVERENSWALPVGSDYVLMEAPDGQHLLDASTGSIVVSLQPGAPGEDDASWSATGGWWHAPPGVPVVVHVRAASAQPAELVAYHLDGHEAWRRAVPARRGSPVTDACCVDVRDGPDGALVVRDGRSGPDALVVTLDAATGATRRVSMRIDPAAPLDPDGSGVPGGWWLTPQGAGTVAGQHPDSGEHAWRLSTFGRQGAQLRIAYSDPLLVVGPGELLRLPTPDDTP